MGSYIESGATTLSLRSSARAERVVAGWGPLPLKWADSGAGAPAGTPLTPCFYRLLRARPKQGSAIYAQAHRRLRSSPRPFPTRRCAAVVAPRAEARRCPGSPQPCHLNGKEESAGFAPARRFAPSQGGHSPVPSSALSVSGGPPAQNAGLGAVVRLGLSALRTALLGPFFVCSTRRLPHFAGHRLRRAPAPFGGAFMGRAGRPTRMRPRRFALALPDV